MSFGMNIPHMLADSLIREFRYRCCEVSTNWQASKSTVLPNVSEVTVQEQFEEQLRRLGVHELADRPSELSLLPLLRIGDDDGSGDEDTSEYPT
jgi:hypothetical protein